MEEPPGQPFTEVFLSTDDDDDAGKEEDHGGGAVFDPVPVEDVADTCPRVAMLAHRDRHLRVHEEGLLSFIDVSYHQAGELINNSRWELDGILGSGEQLSRVWAFHKRNEYDAGLDKVAFKVELHLSCPADRVVTLLTDIDQERRARWDSNAFDRRLLQEFIYPGSDTSAIALDRRIQVYI